MWLSDIIAFLIAHQTEILIVVIGAVIVAGLAFGARVVKMFFIRPKLRMISGAIDSQYTLRFRESPEPLAIHLAKVKVVNNGRDNAGHCQVTCRFKGEPYRLYWKPDRIIFQSMTLASIEPWVNQLYASFYSEVKDNKEADLLRGPFGKEILVFVYVEGPKHAYLFADNKLQFNPSETQKIEIVLNYSRLSGSNAYSEHGLFMVNFGEKTFQRVDC
jgi:hypothetical protein